MINRLKVLLIFLFSFDILAVDLESRKLNMEAMISEQLANQLNQILPQDSFSIMTDVDIFMDNIKIVLESENSEALNGKSQQIKKNLPGFKQTKTPKKKEKILEKKEKFSYEQYLRIKNAKITFIVDENLSEDKRNLAIELIRDKVKTSYGSKGRVVVKKVLLKDEVKNISSGEQAINYLKRQGDLLLLFFMFLVVLIIVLSLLKKNTQTPEKPSIFLDDNKKNFETKKPEISNSNESSTFFSNEKKDDSTKKSQSLFNEIIFYLKEEPFITRSTLRNLNNKTKNILLKQSESPLLKSSLLKILNLKTINQEDKFSNKEIYSYLEKICEEISSNINLQKILINQRFGYLTFLEAHEIQTIMGDNLSREYEILFHYLPSEKFETLLENLPANIKIEIIKSLTNKVSISDFEKDKLDTKLKNNLNLVSRQILSYENTNENIIGNILNNDPQVVETIQSLQSDSSFVFDKSLEKYALTFEDILLKKDSHLKNILSDEDNEIIAKAIINESDENKRIIMNHFGDMRQEIISNIIQNKNFDQEDSNNAKTRILKKYRTKLK